MIEQRKAPNLRQYIEKLPTDGDRQRMIKMAQGLSTPALLELDRQFSRKEPWAEAPSIVGMKELLGKKVGDAFNFPKSDVFRGFEEAGIATVADLVSLTEEKLMRVRFFGPKSMLVLREQLDLKGLRLGMDLTESGIASAVEHPTPAAIKVRGLKPREADARPSIDELVSGLSEKAREIIQLKNQGKTSEEIGQLVGDTPQNVRQILWRAGNKIKPMLAECEQVTKEQFERHAGLFEQMGYSSYRGYVASINIEKAHEARRRMGRKRGGERNGHELPAVAEPAKKLKVEGIIGSMHHKTRAVLEAHEKDSPGGVAKVLRMKQKDVEATLDRAAAEIKSLLRSCEKVSLKVFRKYSKLFSLMGFSNINSLHHAQNGIRVTGGKRRQFAEVFAEEHERVRKVLNLTERGQSDEEIAGQIGAMTMHVARIRNAAARRLDALLPSCEEIDLVVFDEHKKLFELMGYPRIEDVYARQKSISPIG